MAAKKKAVKKRPVKKKAAARPRARARKSRRARDAESDVVYSDIRSAMRATLARRFR